MPRLRVVVLDQDPNNTNVYNCLFWLDVPAARQAYYANAAATSAWINALPADVTALQNGSVVERVILQSFPVGTTLAQVEAYLQNEWQKFQTYITNLNPWLHYGSTWDGTTWAVTTGA